MANIHLKTSYDSTMPRYVGARAVAERVEGGVKITCKDYKGETEEVVHEVIDSIVSNADGSLTFTFLDGETFTTESLTGPQGRGISRIDKTATSGRVDIYTIYYDDGSTSQYSITNGEKGDKGDTGEPGKGIFIARYDSTTFAEIKAALNDGNVVFCRYASGGANYAPVTNYVGSGSANLQHVTFAKVQIATGQINVREYKCTLSSGWSQNLVSIPLSE